ncbi:MAG: DM13 domain-containing protein [Actinomycetota bacterium]
MSFLQNKLVAVGIGAVAAALAAFLAFGVFGIQTLFTDTVVDEGGPTFASGAEVEDSEEFQDAMDEAAENQSEVDESTDDMPMENEVVTLASGSFTSLSRYTVTGDALVLNDGSEQRFLRLEGFESTNGPDLNVYLFAENGDFVDLGDLRGNIGDQNYEIPTDVDLSVFNKVSIWCVRFGVGFGEATLA